MGAVRHARSSVRAGILAGDVTGPVWSREYGTGPAASVSDALTLLRRCSAQAVRVVLDDGDSFFASADNRRHGLIARYAHPVYGSLDHVGRFWDFVNLEQAIERPPPLLGEHSRAILRELAFSEAEIEALLASGTVVQGSVPEAVSQT